MTDYSQHQYIASMELAESSSEQRADSRFRSAMSRLQSVTEDDRYPGTFFRIPGIPTPGKTTWSLVK